MDIPILSWQKRKKLIKIIYICVEVTDKFQPLKGYYTMRVSRTLLGEIGREDIFEWESSFITLVSYWQEIKTFGPTSVKVP